MTSAEQDDEFLVHEWTIRLLLKAANDALLSTADVQSRRLLKSSVKSILLDCQFLEEDLVNLPYARITVLDLVDKALTIGIAVGSVGAAAETVKSLRSKAGQMSGAKRLKVSEGKWRIYATELAKKNYLKNPKLSSADLASNIQNDWAAAAGNYPGLSSLIKHIARLRNDGTLPPRQTS